MIGLSLSECCDHGLQFDQVFRNTDQEQFHPAVIESDACLPKERQSAHGYRVADCSEDIVTLFRSFFRCDPDMMAVVDVLIEFPDRCQEIRRIAENILPLLLCIITCFGKGAESCHIIKIYIIKLSIVFLLLFIILLYNKKN